MAKYKIILLALLSLFFLPIFGSIQTTPKNDSIEAFAFGDIRGHFESCGCDPRTDLGGVARISNFLKREKLEYPNSLVFDLGNNFENPHAPSIKNKYLKKALQQLSVDAALYNQNEQFLDPKFLRSRPYILSNNTTKSPYLKEFIIKGNAIIYGYLSPSESNLKLEPFSNKLITQWKFNLKNQKKEYQLKKVLLFSGTLNELRFASASNFFDLIVLSNMAPQTQAPGKEEKENPNLLLKEVQTNSFYQVPLGGTGILRFGKTRTKEAQSLKQLLKTKEQNTSSANTLFPEIESRDKLNNNFFSEIFVSWLGFAYNEEDSLKDLLAAYNKETAENFDKIAAQRKLQIKHSPFAGAKACAACHKKEYDTWSQSKHHLAYETLIKEGKQFDSECVSCHVVGAKEKGGFVSAKDTPQYAGVQCENCHGARKEHTKNPHINPNIKINAKTVCTSCHHSPHVAEFDFAKYWVKIKH